MNKKSKQLKPIISIEEQIALAESKQSKLAAICNPYSRDNITKSGIKQYVQKQTDPDSKLSSSDPAYQMMSLFEFDNSLLIAGSFKEDFRVIITDLSAKFQAEYDCKTTSERATAHLVAQNYVRTLQIQRYIYMLLDRDSFTDLSTQRLGILEKAYDRANRQYLLSLQALQAFKLPPINVKLFAQNAMVGQYQQVVNKSADKYGTSEINNAK